MPCTWRECITLFTEELPWLTGGDLELVMGRAVCAWVDWKLPGALGWDPEAAKGGARSDNQRGGIDTTSRTQPA
jgi:hypothetical protein